MAKQKGTEIIGTYNGIIYYKWKGIYCLRIKGKTGRQGKAAKEQSHILGTASNLSARLRKALAPLSGGPGDRKLMYRLNNALQQWLYNNPIPLTNFSFKGKPPGYYFTHPVTVSRNATVISLDIPALDPAHQSSGNVLPVIIMAVSCHMKDKSDTRVYEAQVDMEAGKPHKIELPLTLKENCLTVVTMSVNGWAAGVVAVGA